MSTAACVCDHPGLHPGGEDTIHSTIVRGSHHVHPRSADDLLSGGLFQMQYLFAPHGLGTRVTDAVKLDYRPGFRRRAPLS